MIIKVPVGNLKPFKKKWWQFWRKKGDSAEESLASLMADYKGEINWKNFYRLNSIRRIYKIEPIPLTYKKKKIIGSQIDNKNKR